MHGETCDGETHTFWWSDDSYSQGSNEAPCPGPDKCKVLDSPHRKKKETAAIVTPATQFHIVTQVIMTEFIPQRDDPPGRPPYKTVPTVLAEIKRPIRRHEVAQAVENVRTIA